MSALPARWPAPRRHWLCFAWYIATRNPLALSLSWFGFTINLFNLLPVPPLDGGRVAAAISPWIWIVGLCRDGSSWCWRISRLASRSASFVLILIFALPRIVKTLKPKGRSGPYYAIGRDSAVGHRCGLSAFVGVARGAEDVRASPPRERGHLVSRRTQECPSAATPKLASIR